MSKEDEFKYEIETALSICFGPEEMDEVERMLGDRPLKDFLLQDSED